MGILRDMKLEEATKNELKRIKKKQGKSFYSFLCLLTENRFNHLPVQDRMRRIAIEKPGLNLQMIPDHILKSLYLKTNKAYERYCTTNFSRSGYDRPHRRKL